MNIIYNDDKVFSANELQQLFESVQWESAKYPEELRDALSNYGCVFSARDGQKLIGLIATMDDKVLNAYVHYLLVHPDYRKLGIGKKLVALTKDHYKDFKRIILVSYPHGVGFYQSCGFEVIDDGVSMHIMKM